MTNPHNPTPSPDLQPGSPEAIKAAEMLEEMAGIYPGDPTGALIRDACHLRGIPYDPPEVIFTPAASEPAADVAGLADEITTRLYRRFKDWSQRGFSADDVTWCEVKADIIAMIATLSTERDEAGAGKVGELVERLRGLLTPESPMHPIGCATWEQEALYMIECAADTLLAQQAEIEGLKEGADDQNRTAIRDKERADEVQTIALEWRARATAAEAKLAKAREALDRIQVAKRFEESIIRNEPEKRVHFPDGSLLTGPAADFIFQLTDCLILVGAAAAEAYAEIGET